MDLRRARDSKGYITSQATYFITKANAFLDISLHQIRQNSLITSLCANSNLQTLANLSPYPYLQLLHACFAENLQWQSKQKARKTDFHSPPTPAKCRENVLHTFKTHFIRLKIIVSLFLKLFLISHIKHGTNRAKIKERCFLTKQKYNCNIEPIYQSSKFS